MLIELHRKQVAAEYSRTCCAVCGNDFDLGSVYPMVSGDQGHELGEMCPVCLDYLNRRKEDAKDPTLGNWPARGWPSPQDLEEARWRYPEPMFETEEDLLAAVEDRAAEVKMFEDTVVWAMERENATA
jgi:hypothetical protein